MSSKKIHTMVCDKCGNSYEISNNTYKVRKFRNNPNLCFECMKKYKFEKQSKFLKNLYTDQSKKEKMIERLQNGLKNMTDEDKQRMRKNHSIASFKRYEKLNEHYKTSISIKNAYDNLLYDDRVAKELKFIINYNNGSIEYTKTIIEKSLTDVNGIEGIFMKLLYENNIKFIYQYYNIIEYPEFNNLFPYNPITGSNYVSPFHRWDFKILTNKCDIFVDIDGSIHDKNQTNRIVTFTNKRKGYLSDKQSFDDSQRKYQTDNLLSYIIQCYNDILNMNNKVINVYDDNDIISLEEFINMIKELV